MLVLTRKMGEALMIGDDIKVVLIGICGRSVRVGIEAPDGVSIQREEVRKRMAEEKRADQENNGRED